VHIHAKHAVELLFMEDEQMIEALTPYTAEKPLTDGIRARGVLLLEMVDNSPGPQTEQVLAGDQTKKPPF